MISFIDSYVLIKEIFYSVLDAKDPYKRFCLYMKKCHVLRL